MEFHDQPDQQQNHTLPEDTLTLPSNKLVLVELEIGFLIPDISISLGLNWMELLRAQGGFQGKTWVFFIISCPMNSLVAVENNIKEAMVIEYLPKIRNIFDKT